MLRERMSFPETLETLARRFGVPIPEGRFEPGPDRKERDALLALMEAAAEHFARTLGTAPGTKAREYLLGRGFQKETLERIRAGAAPRQLGRPARGARAGATRRTTLQKAGLVLARKSGDGHYDRFRDRAVFPILNEGGKVVGFGARSLDGSEPKYLNSPESPVYHKGRVLYGLSWAREAIRQRAAGGADGGLPRRGPGPRVRGRGGGGDLRHRAHRLPRTAAAALRGHRLRELRPGRGGAAGGPQEPGGAPRGGPPRPGGGAARGARPRQLPQGRGRRRLPATGSRRRRRPWSG